MSNVGVLPVNGTSELLSVGSPSLTANLQSPKNNHLPKTAIGQILLDAIVDASLVEYMVAHGVISSASAKELLQMSEADAKIKKLLDLFDSENESPQHYSHDAKLVLLTNALRSSGQHALASRLDCGRKIKPAPSVAAKSGNLDNSFDGDSTSDAVFHMSRRRGQLSLWMQVAAIRLSPPYYNRLMLIPSSPSQLRSSSCAAWKATQKRRLESDVDSACGDGSFFKNLLETSNGAYFWIDLKSSSILSSSLEREHTPSPGAKTRKGIFSSFFCFVCCLGHRKQRKHVHRTEAPENGPRSACSSMDYRLPSSVLQCSPGDRDNEPTPNLQEETKERARLELLRQTKLDILDTKSNDFYTTVLNPLSDAVVKFLEQTLGVLVLGGRLQEHCPPDCLPKGFVQPCSSAATISIVVTTREALERLHTSVTPISQEKSHCSSSSALSSALEAIFRGEVGFLEAIDVQDIRLSVGLREEEFNLVARELEE